MIVIAHAGHWAVQALYGAPLLVMIAMLLIGRWRAKHEAARTTGDERHSASDAAEHRSNDAA